MSGTQRRSIETSDFSIARILADDGRKRTVACPFESTVCARGDITVKIQNISQSEINVHDNKKDTINIRKDKEQAVLTRGTMSCVDRDDDTKSRNKSTCLHVGVIEPCISNPVSPNDYNTTTETTQRNELTWLQYTRYRPPKLPRRPSIGKIVKRRAGVHPRIPFSSFQLQVLEDKYKTSAYLSRDDVVEVSTSLRLPQSRVKIWFQNRRARERRELHNTVTIT